MLPVRMPMRAVPSCSLVRGGRIIYHCARKRSVKKKARALHGGGFTRGVSWGRAWGRVGARGILGAGGGVNSQLCRASIAGGGAAPPVQRSRQVPPRALRACHLRRQGALGAALGAGRGWARDQRRSDSTCGCCGWAARWRRRSCHVCKAWRVAAAVPPTTCAAARGAALRGRGGGQGRPQAREALPGRPPCPPQAAYSGVQPRRTLLGDSEEIFAKGAYEGVFITVRIQYQSQ